jgi:exosome complex exonuclease DIS3/RRP44
MVEITIRKRPRSEAVVTQRKFFKKTAKGKVIKGEFPTIENATRAYDPSVLRERYLRDDVACGIEQCRECNADVLPASGDRTHTMFPHGHFILPDTNVFLSQVNSYCQSM